MQCIWWPDFGQEQVEHCPATCWSAVSFSHRDDRACNFSAHLSSCDAQLFRTLFLMKQKGNYGQRSLLQLSHRSGRQGKRLELDQCQRNVKNCQYPGFLISCTLIRDIAAARLLIQNVRGTTATKTTNETTEGSVIY